MSERQLSESKCATFWRNYRKNGATRKHNYTPLKNKDFLTDNRLLVVKADNEVGYEFYQVSSRTGKYNELKPFIIEQNSNKKPYYYVAYYNREKKTMKIIQIANLVYITFKGDIPQGFVVDHIDNNGLNNSLDNLQLLTRKDNANKDRKSAKKFKNAYVELTEDELVRLRLDKIYTKIAKYESRIQKKASKLTLCQIRNHSEEFKKNHPNGTENEKRLKEELEELTDKVSNLIDKAETICRTKREFEEFNQEIFQILYQDWI